MKPLRAGADTLHVFTADAPCTCGSPVACTSPHRTRVDRIAYLVARLSPAAQASSWYLQDVMSDIGYEAQRDRDNLLARIHRDGGHHTARVGTAQSVLDADQIVANLFYEVDTLRIALDATEWSGVDAQGVRRCPCCHATMPTHGSLCKVGQAKRRVAKRRVATSPSDLEEILEEVRKGKHKK